MCRWKNFSFCFQTEIHRWITNYENLCSLFIFLNGDVDMQGNVRFVGNSWTDNLELCRVLQRWSIMSYFYWKFRILTLNLGRHVGLPAVYLHCIMSIGAETYRWVSRNLFSVIHNVKDLSDPLIMVELITLNLLVIYLNFRINEQRQIISYVKSKQKGSEKSKWGPKYFCIVSISNKRYKSVLTLSRWALQKGVSFLLPSVMYIPLRWCISPCLA